MIFYYALLVVTTELKQAVSIRYAGIIQHVES